MLTLIPNELNNLRAWFFNTLQASLRGANESARGEALLTGLATTHWRTQCHVDPRLRFEANDLSRGGWRLSNDKFHIVAQRERCLLHITMRDQWTVETVAAYKAALLPEIERLVMGGCKPGSIVSLMDARQRGPQSQEVIAAFQEQLGGKLSPRRLAILVSSALFERQVQRIDIPNQRMFTDEDEATAWLLSPDEPA